VGSSKRKRARAGKVEKGEAELYEFRNPDFINRLANPSFEYANIPSLTKLALLGDALLALIFRNIEIYKDKDKVDITLFSPSNAYLAEMYEAMHLPFEKITEETNSPHRQKKINWRKGTTVEALVGAVFLDSGSDYFITRRVVRGMWGI
jgi:23S rRNA maturation mini-RNase III